MKIIKETLIGNNTKSFTTDYTKPSCGECENEKDCCLYCGAELSYTPGEEGGFCSIACVDSWYETSTNPEEEE